MTVMRSILLLGFSLAAIAQQCTIPGNVPTTRPTRVDYKNKDIVTDYYGLSLSWVPQFCNSQAGKNPNNKWQCADNSFGFVVHGLWPQSSKARRNDEHPRNCKAPELLPAATIKPHLCTIPGAQLMQDEWVKHGTCAFPNAKAYLDQIEVLYKNLVLPDLKAGMTTSGAIRKQIVAANQSKGLKPEHTEVRVLSGNRFSEFMVCYDKSFKFAACADKGAPDHVEVRVAAKR
jgi:ribonuclease T2